MFYPPTCYTGQIILLISLSYSAIEEIIVDSITGNANIGRRKGSLIVS